jgi:hypothetical protein
MYHSLTRVYVATKKMGVYAKQSDAVKGWIRA